MADLITLRNEFLTAKIDAEDGRLVHLSENGTGPGLIRDTAIRYVLMEGERSKSTYMLTPGSPAPAPAPGTGDQKPIRCTGVTQDTRGVSAAYVGDHMALDLRYELDESSPLLRVTSTAHGTGTPGKLQFIWAPRFLFTEGFNEQFEDPQDLYDDGVEVEHGVEMPCWRVFFRKGHRDGLLLATRSKANMSHFNIIADGFEVQPQASLNYSTKTLGNEDALQGESTRAYASTYELGPWSLEQHKAILRKAELNKPVQVKHPRAKGKPRPKLKGKIIHAAKLAPRAAVSRTHHPRKWHVVSVPWSQSGKALFASTGVAPAAFTVDPKLKGIYHVYAGVGNGEGLTMKASGDPETRIRISRHGEGHGSAVAWMLCLAGPHKAHEVDFGIMKLDGRKLRLGRFPDLQRPCMLDYLRFEKLSDRKAKQWELQEQREPRLPLAGFFDTPDVTTIMDAKNPDGRTYAADVWEHANSRVRRIYYRIDGQCSDFPTKYNTLRYISAKVHGVFSPHSKAYGRLLEREDILRIAVDAGKKYGVDIWGWMRFNNYTGNVQSDFFKKNPQFWEEWENGRKGSKLCVAHPEVRKHKIDILVDAAKRYALPGLCLGFLRHPPVLMYAQITCDAYEKEYGRKPPRDPKNLDPGQRNGWPSQDEEYQRWWSFRARYMTTFGRELRAALKAAKCEHVKIALWLRANHCLFDGIDLETWINEGLCDEVIAQTYAGTATPEHDWPTPQWKAMVQAKVPLAHGLPHTSPEAKAELSRTLAAGFDGLVSYESNDTVLDSEYIEIYRSLRK